MIEYDYKIVRDESDEKTIFIPDKIPTRLNNLVQIEGPNSSGKSTLLHILALCLYGLKNDSIPQSLKQKMSNLYDSTHQKLTFSVNIGDNEGSLRIISRKTDSEVPQFYVSEVENGVEKPISYERFDKKYHLIYDIPEDPTGRLNNLTSEIRSSQTIYGNKVASFKQYLHSIIKDVRDSQDPNKINDFRKQLDNIDEDKKIHEGEIRLMEDELDMLEKATYYKYYTHYFDLHESYQNELKMREKEIKKIGSSDKKQNKLINTCRLTLNTNLHEMDQMYIKLTDILRNILPKDEKNHLSIWDRINFKQVIEHLEFNESLIQEVTHFEYVLNLELEKYDRELLQKINFYESMIKLLEHYNLNVSTEHIDISASEFVGELKSELDSNKHLIELKEKIDYALGLLNELKAKHDYLQSTILPELIQSKSNTNNDSDNRFDVLESEIDYYIQKIEASSKKTDYYEQELLKTENFDPNLLCNFGVGILVNYLDESEDKLLTDILSLKDSIISKKAQLKDIKRRYDLLKIEISILEKKEPHKYQKYLSELNNLFDNTSHLESKIRGDYDDYIGYVLAEKIKNKSSLSNDQSIYYDAIFKYLGKRLGNIRHIDNLYGVDKVDLIDKVVVTDSGKNIKFLDMGTGQSQSAYILSLLRKSDDRKIIALFDEIAMMDSLSLEPIYSEVRKLRDNGKLLAALFVQKTDSDEVIIKDV